MGSSLRGRWGWWVLAMLGWVAGAQGITIGAGPARGTDRRGTIWYEEFQDWTAADLRALDDNADSFPYNVADASRDLVAFYSREEGENLFFRTDLFDLSYNAWNGEVDLYVAIDCAPGGNSSFPDSLDTNTDHPWEICIKLYSDSLAFVQDATGADVTSGNWLGSYWHGSLDSVEFGIKKSLLTARGWNGTSPLHFQVATARDLTELAGSELTDALGTLTRDAGGGIGLLAGGCTSTNTAGRALYAVIAHANQSVGAQSGTQNHLFTDRGDINLYPGFVRLLDSAEMFEVPVNLHVSGTLLMSFQWAVQNPADPDYPLRDGPTFLARMRDFVTTGPGSLLGGVLAEHIMPYFEGDVNRRSIAQNAELLQNLFGLGTEQLKVMHTPERVIHSDTNSPHVNPAGPLRGRVFEDIAAAGFQATYLDEVTHLHWWFYPGEQNNPGWDEFNCGRWAGGQGNDEEPYHHKIHKVNGVDCFLINDREDQAKFGNYDGGMERDTRYTLLQKARSADAAQLTLVFDDWEAFAGNSFASSTPNNNADQFHLTLRWAANHPWIQLVNLKDVLALAAAQPAWVVDHGGVYDKSMQTYEWLKRASEHDYDHWYYGSPTEESFFDRVPRVIDAWAPAGMKHYGDLNTPGTLLHDSWQAVESITSTNLRRLAEWSYSAMIYETAWHDEDANPDQYQSRNYQVTFNRNDACTTAYEDTSYDAISGWALRLHGHARDLGVLKAASDWVADVRSGAQGAATRVSAADIDDDTLEEYVLCNDRVFLCFERWGARLVKAFVYDPAQNGGDAVEVIGVPVANPAEESENERADQNRCSAFKDRYNTGLDGNHFVDMDFASASPLEGADYWEFRSDDGRIVKRVRLPAGRDVVFAEYAMSPAVGVLYTRYGLGPNQLDLMLRGPSNLVSEADASFRGLRNTAGGAAYVVAGRNMGFVNGTVANAGWAHRELPLVEQFETYSTSTNWTVALAFSRTSAADLDGDGLSNTNEMARGTDHERADTDGDGLPDGYEAGHGLDPLQQADGVLDLDEDGLSNWSEWMANTAADDPQDFFKLASVARGGGGVEVRHETRSSRWYRIFFADALTSTGWVWRVFGQTNEPVGQYFERGAGGPRAFTDDFTAATSGHAPSNGVRVYSIGVKP